MVQRLRDRRSNRIDILDKEDEKSGPGSGMETRGWRTRRRTESDTTFKHQSFHSQEQSTTHRNHKQEHTRRTERTENIKD
jgi:hypothetical protein